MVICREIYLESIDNLDGVDGGSDCTPLRRTIVYIKHAMDRRSRTTNEYTIPYVNSSRIERKKVIYQAVAKLKKANTSTASISNCADIQLERSTN